MEETFAVCIALGRSLGFEEDHSRQDARLAALLFDQTSGLHGLDDAYRDLLICAGLLHDIGYVEGYEGHHKTAYRYIMKAQLPGLGEREKRIVANVARYHRGARPRASHAGLAGLEPEEREIVDVLGALLRLADGLDRSHTDAVRHLEVWIDGGRMEVSLDCPLGCATEVWAGAKKGRWLAELFGVHLEVREGRDRP